MDYLEANAGACDPDNLSSPMTESVVLPNRFHYWDNHWIDRILELMYHVDTYIPSPTRDTELPFLMAVEGVVSITGRGTVATGRIERGTIRLGDNVDIVGYSSRAKVKQTTVTGIEMFQKNLPQGLAGDSVGLLLTGPTESDVVYHTVGLGAIIEIVGYSRQEKANRPAVTGIELFQKNCPKGLAGDNVGLLLRGTTKSDVVRGMVVAQPGSIQTQTCFEATVYVLKKEEGGRHTSFSVGYKPQFYIRTTDVTGEVLSYLAEDGSELEMVLPGDKVRIAVRLIHGIAIEKGMRFAIREGSKTVGAGVVDRIGIEAS